MKKINLLVILFILFFTVSGLFFLTSANAAIIYVPDQPDSTNIQPAVLAAVDSANNGDVILLPAGIFFFDRKVVITEFISFRGIGIGNTILYRRESVPDNTLSNDSNWEGMLKFDINQTISSNIVVSDITFKSKYPSYVQGDGGSLALDRGIIMIKSIDFLITRCRFEYFGKSAVMVKHSDVLARGLIYNNEFYHNSKGSNGNGWGYGVEIYGDNDQWIPNLKFGTDNFIFIEDNLFDHHRHSIAAGGAALYVARHNTIFNSFIFHAIDTHDGNGNINSENRFSTRAVEVYENTIKNTKFTNGDSIVPGQSVQLLTQRAIAIRGAEAVVYANTISGFRFGCGINLQNRPSDHYYPVPFTTGYLSGLQFGVSHTGINLPYGNGDLFYWENNFTPYNGTGTSIDLKCFDLDTLYFKLHRDYHTVAKPGYTPYTYPHPLRSLSPSLNTQPASIKLAIDGFYNATTDRLNMSDTVRIYLRNISLPYNVIDSAKSVVDPATMTGSFLFSNAPTGTYYLQLKGRNCIETWSKAGGESYFFGNAYSYDFTTANSRAYGNNMKQVNTSPVRFAVYSGDVNQDGVVDLPDLTAVCNSSISFSSGYLKTDLTGDGIVDQNDIIIAYNNSINFVSKRRP